MSTSLMKKIAGRLVNQQGLALEQLSFGITVELMTSIDGPSPGGWIGSAPVKVADATFEIFTAYALGTTDQVYYRILNGNELVATGSVQTNTFSVAIGVTPDQYKLLTQTDITGYTLIKGTITLGNAAIAAVPLSPSGMMVYVNKEKFKVPEELGQGIIDLYGNYQIKVPNRLLQMPGTSCSDNANAKIFVTLGKGATLITRTDILEVDSCCVTADLHVADPGDRKSVV